jgi:hypothetical protein
MAEHDVVLSSWAVMRINDYCYQRSRGYVELGSNKLLMSEPAGDAEIFPGGFDEVGGGQ